MNETLIQYKDVELRRKELTILKNVNFTVLPGQFIFLIGKVGAGKSTLLKSIYADTPIDEGNAQVLGYDLCAIKRKEVPFLRRNIGFVFQDYQLLTDRTVEANLDFVLTATGWTDKHARATRIEQVLRTVGMGKKYYKMPHELSGGEQQRIAIARALLNKPRLILADEPTGNLDPDTGEQVMLRLYDISCQGTTVIIATHNHSLIDQFPGRVMLCENKSLSVTE